MGFFDAFTGEAQKRDITKANRRATDELNRGETRARGEMTGGFAEADRFLRDAGRGLNSSTAGQTGELTAGEAGAMGLLDPYIGSGTRANALLADALGMNGLDRQRAFGDNFAASDPFRQQNADMATEAIMRSLNARGMSGSGFAAEAVARQNLERGSIDWSNYLDRLTGQQSAGQSAATAGAGIRTNMAAGRANILGQTAGQTADLMTRRAMNASDRGNALANLTYGAAQQRAGNRINMGNAMAETRGIGINNLLRFGEIAAKAASGGKAGG